MAVSIRLKRMGRKKKPFYRIVVMDSRKKRDGKYIEKVGHYNPIVNPAEIVISEEKALHWLQLGAIPSDTVSSMFSRQGILLKFDMMKKGFSDQIIEEEMKKWELLQIERAKRGDAEEAQALREQKKPSSESENAVVSESA